MQMMKEHEPEARSSENGTPDQTASQTTAAETAPAESESVFTFDQLPAPYADNVAALGWKEAMEVQQQAIPLVLRGIDAIVQSHTGSGKTAAFVLPLLMRIDQNLKQPQAMVLVPTRELAIQVHHAFEELAANSGCHGALLYGGVGYGKQLDALKAGAQLIIGTPGRIIDHIERGTLSLASLKHLVMDEADEMLSMGFYPAMRRIRRWLPSRRQSLMFSATMPRAVRNLAAEFLYNPRWLSLSGDDQGIENLLHSFYRVDPMNKDRALSTLIEMENPSSALIFCNRKSDVEYLYQYLANAGYNVDRISGDLGQRARERVMETIRKQELRFLIATDVAARGIDISDIEIVFQYDVPQDHEIYVHRSGRTARAGKTGRCITLATYMDEHQLREIRRKYSIQIEEKELPDKELVSARVRERTMVLLEEQLRDSGSIDRERVDRFVALADELSSHEEGRRTFALLLDEFYHRSLHLPQELPKERERFEDIKDRPRRSRSKGRSQDSHSRRAPREGDTKRHQTSSSGDTRAKSRTKEQSGSSKQEPAK